jgi:hypothetical protein
MRLRSCEVMVKVPGPPAEVAAGCFHNAPVKRGLQM